MIKIINKTNRNKEFISSIRRARYQYKNGEVLDMQDIFADII